MTREMAAGVSRILRGTALALICGSAFHVSSLAQAQSPEPPSARSGSNPRIAEDALDRLYDLWNDLASTDDKTAARAVQALARRPAESVPFLRRKLKPVTIDPAAVKKWLADLASDNADARDAAAANLDYVAPLIQSELRALLENGPNPVAEERLSEITYGPPPAPPAPIPAPPLAGTPPTATNGTPPAIPPVETASGVPAIDQNDWGIDSSRLSWKRVVRTVAVLEQIGTPDAVALLKTLSNGRIEALPTQAAQDALIRLHRMTPSEEIPKIRAVFETYQKARAKGDKRAALACVTPERVDDEVMGALMLCEIKRVPNAVAVMKKFRLDMDAVGKEFEKRFEKKYGAKPDKLNDDYTEKMNKAVAAYEKRTGKSASTMPGPLLAKEVGPPPPNGQDLLKAVACEKLTDKVGFVAEMYDAAKGVYSDRMQIGDLKKIHVQGDVAVGRVTLEGTSAPAQFRKTKQGWLIDITW